MRAPDWWYREPKGRESAPAIRALLSPVAWLWREETARRIRSAAPCDCGLPVVCVGNLTMGGAGKTPVTRAIRAELGSAAHTLSRGYGGSDKGPRLVRADDPVALVGDEPLLHAKDGPAWIAANRVQGAEAAKAAGAKAIVMDDGFQNMALKKSLSVLVFDAAVGIGNGLSFPVGPLREPLAQGLPRAQAVVMMRASEEADRTRPEYLQAFSGPIFDAWLAPEAPSPEGPVLAFAGIARPQKFFDTLTASGAALVDAASYPDHHVFSEKELAWLEDHAAHHGARLITTEKDAVRLPPAWRAKVEVLPVRARFADPAALKAVLAPVAALLASQAA